jgi:hypothetical protein
MKLLTDFTLEQTEDTRLSQLERVAARYRIPGGIVATFWRRGRTTQQLMEWARAERFLNRRMGGGRRF